MKTFYNLFKRSDKPTPGEAQSQQEMTPCKTQQELIERYGGIALDKQINFGEVIGKNSWRVVMAQGTISFGQHLTFPMQSLGTISHSAQTWLWSWANKQAEIPESIIQQSLQLKKYGEDNGIDLLQVDTFPFSKDQLHLIGLIASGIFNSSGYYIADYGQGAMLFTIKSDVIDKAITQNHERILIVFPQLISLFDMNHRSALRSYLIAKGYTIKESKNSVTGTKNGKSITGQFDNLFRLTQLNG